MATSSDQDDDRSDEDKTEAEPRDEPEEQAGTPEAKAEAEAEAEAKAEAEAEAKAEPAKRAKPAKGKGKRAKAQRPAAAAPPPTAQGGSLGKSLVLFLIIVGGLAAGFAFFGRETGGTGNAPKWKAGDKAEVEITLVASDIKELACWSPEEVKGRHCAFESPTKGWSKGGDASDQNLLKPYTTTDRVQFLGAGLWSQPALTGTLPKSRFAVKCTYTVEGRLKRPGIRWSSEGAWLDRTEDWYAGLLSDCRLLNP